MSSPTATSGTEISESGPRPVLTDPILLAARKLGAKAATLGEIHFEDDHFTDATGRVFSHSTSAVRICDLQVRYGTSRVVHAPDPLLLLQTSNRPQRANTLLVLAPRDLQLPHVERLLSHMARKYGTVERLTLVGLERRSTRDFISLVGKLRVVSFVIVVGCDRHTAGLVVGSETPFCLINPSYSRYSDYLGQLGLESLVVKAHDYEMLKTGFKALREVIGTCMTGLGRRLESIRRYASWTRHCIVRSCNEGSSSRSPPSHPIGGLHYYCQGNERPNCPFLTELYVDFTDRASTRGVCIDPYVNYSFISGRRVRRYPWLGILETDRYLEKLLTTPEFLVSLDFCQGLYLLSGDCPSTEQQVETTCGRLVPVRQAYLPVCPDVEPFDISKFERNPRLVSYHTVTTVTTLERPGEVGPQRERHRETSRRGNSEGTRRDTLYDELVGSETPPSRGERQEREGTRSRPGSSGAESPFSSGDDTPDTSDYDEYENSPESPRDMDRFRRSGSQVPSIRSSDAIRGGPGSIGELLRNSPDFQLEVEYPTSGVGGHLTGGDSSDDSYSCESGSSSDGDPTLDVPLLPLSTTTEERSSGRDLDLLSSCVVLLGEESDFSPVGVVSSAIARCTPLVLRRSRWAERILGRDYPLYYEEGREPTSSLTLGKVESAVTHLEYLGSTSNVAQWLLSLSETRIGRKIAALSPN